MHMHSQSPSRTAYCFSIRCSEVPMLVLKGCSEHVQASLQRLMGRTCKQSMGSDSSCSACLRPGRTTQCSCTSRSLSLHSAMVRQPDPAVPRPDFPRCGTASWKLCDACKGTCLPCQMACLLPHATTCCHMLPGNLPEACFMSVYQALQRKICLFSLTSIMISSHDLDFILSICPVLIDHLCNRRAAGGVIASRQGASPRTAQAACSSHPRMISLAQPV